MLRGHGRQYIYSIFIPFMLSSFEILLELKSYFMPYEILCKILKLHLLGKCFYKNNHRDFNLSALLLGQTLIL